MNYKEAVKIATEFDSNMNVKDSFRHIVYMNHLDGTACEFHHANLKINEVNGEKWYMIFTEHNGFHVYHEEDLEYCYEVNNDPSNNDKVIRLIEMEVDLDEEVIDGIAKLAYKEIKNDKAALFNYGARKALELIVSTDGECLKELKKGKKSIKPKTKK